MCSMCSLAAKPCIKVSSGKFPSPNSIIITWLPSTSAHAFFLRCQSMAFLLLIYKCRKLQKGSHRMTSQPGKIHIRSHGSTLFFLKKHMEGAGTFVQNMPRPSIQVQLHFPSLITCQFDKVIRYIQKVLNSNRLEFSASHQIFSYGSMILSLVMYESQM